MFGTIIVAAMLTGLVSGVLTAPFGDNYAARGIVVAIASAIPNARQAPGGSSLALRVTPAPAADGELGAARAARSRAR